MRISDWSSDVCSSDLVCLLLHGPVHPCLQGNRASFKSDARQPTMPPAAALSPPAATLQPPHPTVAPRVACPTPHRSPHPGRWCGHPPRAFRAVPGYRSEEHTSELKSLMRISYAVFCLKKNNTATKESD